MHVNFRWNRFKSLLFKIFLYINYTPKEKFFIKKFKGIYAIKVPFWTWYKYTRCDLKINVFFLIFLQSIYLFINNSLKYNTLMPAFFPILEILLKRAFWHRQKLLFPFFLLLFIIIIIFIAERFPFIGVFSLGKRKKSPAVKFGEYSGWGMITVLFLAKNSRTSNNMGAGALSWCKIHDWFYQNSVRFWRISSCNRSITSR